MTQITDAPHALAFSDLSHVHWRTVARRDRASPEWSYYWPASDQSRWRNAKNAGIAVCVTRADGDRLVCFGRLVRG